MLPDSGEQRLGRERFGEICRRALLHAPELVGVLILRRHQNDRQLAVARIVANLAAELKTVLAGHDDIEQHQIGAVAIEAAQRLFS
jgi:hypothetical protein